MTDRKKLFGYKAMSQVTQSIHPLEPATLRRYTYQKKGLLELLHKPQNSNLVWIYEEDFLKWLKDFFVER